MNFARLIGLGGERKLVPMESFGRSQIARAQGEEILGATAARRNFVRGIRDRLTSLSREEKDELVDRVLARLALFVFDLPASESNHHSGRFGLLDHLLEVAHQTVHEVSGPGFRVSPEPSVNHREGPFWAYAGLIGAIAHDIGKPLDLDVMGPGTSTTWDPLTEPLKLFCERNGLAETGPGLWHFHRGRGMSGHERHIVSILPIVLTSAATEYLGPRLGSVVDALTRREIWEASREVWIPAREIVRVIRRLDQATSLDHLELRQARKDQIPELVVTSKEGPPGRSAQAEGEEPACDIIARAPEVPTPACLPVSRFTPADLWRDKVASPKNRRGDPTETARRLEYELESRRFMKTLERMIVGRRLSRNSLYSDVYLRPDFAWLIVPKALRRIAQIIRLPFDTEVLGRMFDSFRASSNVHPYSAEELVEYIRTRPDSAAFEAVKIGTPAFIPANDLAALGLHEFEIRIAGAPTSAQARIGAAGR